MIFIFPNPTWLCKTFHPACRPSISHPLCENEWNSALTEVFLYCTQPLQFLSCYMPFALQLWVPSNAMSVITFPDTHIQDHATGSMPSLAIMLSLTDVIPSQPLSEFLVIYHMTSRCKTAPPTCTATQTVQTTVSKPIERL